MRINYVLLVNVCVDAPVEFYLIPTHSNITQIVRESADKKICTTQLLSLFGTNEAQSYKRTPPIHMQPDEFILDIYYF
jgi:hypothetical protein